MAGQRIISKQLAGAEDILLDASGEATVVQERASGPKTITKVNASTIPYEGKRGEVGYKSLAGAIEERLSSVATIASLRLVDYTKENTVNVRGYNTENDSGGGLFNWSILVDKSTADGGVVIDPDQTIENQGSGTGLGCWVRSFTSTISPAMYGAANLNGTYAEYIPFVKALSYAIKNNLEFEGLSVNSNKYVIGADKKIYDQNSQPFVVKGVALFDYLFVSFENRNQYDIRFSSGGETTSLGTGFARVQWVNPQHVEDTIKKAVDDGVNTIRVGVDAAMKNTPAQTSPADGLMYPSDMEMLDTIVYYATKYNLVVELRQGRKDATATEFSSFMVFLIDRYKKFQNVWYNPENEINAGAIDINAWLSDITEYVTTMRAAGCKTPIIINTMNYGGQAKWVESIKGLDSVPALKRDFGLVLGLHVYQTSAELTGFIGNARHKQQDEIIPYAYGKYPVIIEEIGISNNLTGGDDPILNNPSSDSSLFITHAQTEWMREYMRWVVHQIQVGGLSGCIATTYNAYIPGTDKYDVNTMRMNGRPGDTDWALTAWGTIFIERFLKSKQRYVANKGECKLVRENGAIRLKPFNGNNLVINHVPIQVPYTNDFTDPVKVDLTGLLDNTNYYIYASLDDTGTATKLKIEAFEVGGTDEPYLDPISGVWHKKVFTQITTDVGGQRFDDCNHTLVGMIRVVAGDVPDTETQRFVRSWFNRGAILLQDKISADVVPDASNLITGLSVEFLLWNDEKINLKFASRFVPTATGNTTTHLRDNAIVQYPEIVQSVTATNNEYVTQDVIIGDGLNSYHKVDVYAIGGGTSTFKAGGRLNGIL